MTLRRGYCHLIRRDNFLAYFYVEADTESCLNSFSEAGQEGRPIQL